MRKLIAAFGTSALIFAFADGIHGQHNGDKYRLYIHIAEFVSFFGFLWVLAIQAFMTLKARLKLSPWLAAALISLVSSLGGFALFIFSGGSGHGDGGAIAISFALTGFIGTIGVPLSAMGSLIALIMRKRNGSGLS